MAYIIYIDGSPITTTQISGTEFAYAAWRKACELADLLDETCDLVDAVTGEIVASSEDF